MLDLIARILGFNEEQKIAVGLKVGPIDFMSTILSTVSVVIGVPPPPPEPINVEVRSCAFLYVCMNIIYMYVCMYEDVLYFYTCTMLHLYGGN